jgi:integrase
VDVLETLPKKGRVTSRHKIPIENMSDESLRKRKKTFNAVVSILRGAFELAWERSELESDRPLRCLRRLPNLDRPRIIFLSRSECRRLIASCNADLAQLVLAALYSGCRVNELIGMRVGDYLPDKRAVFVSKPKGRRTRYVFLPPEAVPLFRSLTYDRSASDFMFRKANGRAWSSEYKTYFQKARIDAGLPTELTFHGLRHTYASQLIQSGASLIAVADQLGHANTQTVSATYGHLAGYHRRDEISRHFETLEDFRKAERLEDHGDDFASAELPPPVSTSWPLANFSKYNGSLLPLLKNSK